MKFYKTCDYISLCEDRETNRVIVEDDMVFVMQGSSISTKGDNLINILYHLLPSFLRNRVCEEEIEESLSAACLDLNRFIESNYNTYGYVTLSGIINVNAKLYILHIGDCNVVFFNGIVPVYTTEPHTMNNKVERERIEEESFTYCGKAEGLFRITRCFGNYVKWSQPLPYVEKIDKRVTHCFLYTSRLKVDLSTLIITLLSNQQDKVSAVIINESKHHNNVSLAILHLPVISGLHLPVISGLHLPVISGLHLPVISGPNQQPDQKETD